MERLTSKEVMKKQLNILSIVDTWCREHHLPYFLAYGTLLGAVRHHGYIPWDDDIDICMFRSDFERFINEFNQDRKKPFHALHCSIDPSFPYEFAKVADYSTKLVEHTDIFYEIRINIDVFILDPAINQSRQMNKIVWKNKLPGKILNIKNILSNQTMKELGKPRTGIKRLGVYILKKTCNLVPVLWCTSSLNKNAKMFANRQSTGWVADLCQRWFKGKELLRKEWFDHPVELEFEGHKFFAPSNYDAVLTAWYGDYMQLPPEEERVTHHDYKAYQL